MSSEKHWKRQQWRIRFELWMKIKNNEGNKCPPRRNLDGARYTLDFKLNRLTLCYVSIKYNLDIDFQIINLWHTCPSLGGINYHWVALFC